MTLDHQRLAELAAEAANQKARYHNLEPVPAHGWREFLRWQKQHGWRFPPGKRMPLLRPDDKLLAQPGASPQITWLGHASFLIQYQGCNILTDPVFSKRCSPLSLIGPKRFTPPALQLDELPPIDLVVISHNHYDHLDKRSVRWLHWRFDTQVQFLVPQGVKHWFDKQGINNVVELGWWQTHALSVLEACFVPAQHFSGRTFSDRNATLWGGWWLTFDDFSLYFAGDTGYGQVFQTMHDVLGAPDLALLPIGAYEPRWMMQAVHADPYDAVQIHCDLQAKQSIGMHWGTFVLTDEPMDEPPRKLAEALNQKGIAAESFSVMTHGETRTITTES